MVGRWLPVSASAVTIPSSAVYVLTAIDTVFSVRMPEQTAHIPHFHFASLSRSRCVPIAGWARLPPPPTKTLVATCCMIHFLNYHFSFHCRHQAAGRFLFLGLGDALTWAIPYRAAAHMTSSFRPCSLGRAALTLASECWQWVRLPCCCCAGHLGAVGETGRDFSYAEHTQTGITQVFGIVPAGTR